MVKYTSVSGIYVILNTKNGNIYIGQTQDFRKRCKEHAKRLNKGRHENSHLQHAWNKYGESSFKFQLLEYCDVDKLNKREQHFLDIYMKKGICYNIAKDATAPARGAIRSIESRLKMSASQKKRPPMTEETRLKFSARRGENHPMFGKSHSEESRRKMSESKKGIPSWNKGIPHSPETKRKLSEANKGKSPPNKGKKGQIPYNKGKKASEETRHKLSEVAKNRPPVSDETRWKNGTGKRGKTLSEETRRKISESVKLQHARRKAKQTEDN